MGRRLPDLRPPKERSVIEFALALMAIVLLIAMFARGAS
jgi:hypothetical protein